jgi:CheY-like chemotaxis protein
MGGATAPRVGPPRRRTTTSSSARTRVVLVDDDHWVRQGRAAAFVDDEKIEVVATASTLEARWWRTEWQGVDVVVIDPMSGPDVFDRFRGVSVVEHLREVAGSSRRPRVVAVTAAASNAYLRLRLAGAGADHVYHRREAADPTTFARVVANPDEAHRLGRAEDLERPPGLRVGAQPNELLAAIEQEEVTHAFLPGLAQHETGLSRRTTIRLRRLAADLGGIETAPHRRSGGPNALGVLPTWREVVDQVNAMRGLSAQEAAAEPPFSLVS